jgi:hypothetical protein
MSNTTSSIDMLLDCTLDDLKDLPSFKPFQAGAHRVTASWGTKDINGIGYLTLDFKMLETVELSDLNEAVTGAAGDEAGTMYNLANEYGQGNAKKAAAPFLAALNMSTLRELVEGAHDVECMIITSLRPNKKDPESPYLEVKEVQVV